MGACHRLGDNEQRPEGGEGGSRVGVGGRAFQTEGKGPEAGAASVFQEGRVVGAEGRWEDGERGEKKSGK